MDLVAVYGSLKRGFHNHSVMERAEGKFVTTGVTKDNFIMNGYGYPYIIRDNSENSGRVAVEVYNVDSIKVLDALEGHPHFYKREIIDIEAGGKCIKAWIYIYQREIEADLSLLKNGIYEWKESV